MSFRDIKRNDIVQYRSGGKVRSGRAQARFIYDDYVMVSRCGPRNSVLVEVNERNYVSHKRNVFGRAA